MNNFYTNSICTLNYKTSLINKLLPIFPLNLCIDLLYLTIKNKMDHFGIQELSKLFASPGGDKGDFDSSDSENESENKACRKIRKSIRSFDQESTVCCLTNLYCQDPGTIGQESQIPQAKASSDPKPITAQPTPTKSIWNDASGIQAPVLPDVSNDPRKTPEVSMSFQQTVKTEDVFLGIGFKTPGTASCESITVTIKLPEETSDAKASNFQLDLKEQWIEFRSAKYVLIHPLPYPINPRDGTAKWLADKCELLLTLKIGERQLDAFNF